MEVVMFGEFENVKITIEGTSIKRNSIYEQGKIDARIQHIIRKLQEKDSRFYHTRENSNDFITFEGNKIAIIRIIMHQLPPNPHKPLFPPQPLSPHWFVFPQQFGITSKM